MRLLAMEVCLHRVSHTSSTTGSIRILTQLLQNVQNISTIHTDTNAVMFLPVPHENGVKFCSGNSVQLCPPFGLNKAKQIWTSSLQKLSKSHSIQLDWIWFDLCTQSLRYAVWKGTWKKSYILTYIIPYSFLAVGKSVASVHFLLPDTSSPGAHISFADVLAKAADPF